MTEPDNLPSTGGRHALQADEPETSATPEVPAHYLLGSEAAPARTLWDVVRTTAENYPEAAALDDGEILTYAELLADVSAWATELHASGVRRGDRIGIRMTSGLSLIHI